MKTSGRKLRTKRLHSSYDTIDSDEKKSSSHPAAKAKMSVLTGLAALSLDALSSVAYGPEEIDRALMEGKANINLTIVITLCIVGLLTILIISYRQVIKVFPGGGGSYAVAKKFFTRREALIAASSLIIDYVLNVAVAISAGVAAAWSAFPVLGPYKVWLALGCLLFITAVNLKGVIAGARVFIVPTALFILAMLIVITLGLLHRAPPAAAIVGSKESLHGLVHDVSFLVLLKAFANGCSALTGIEAIANAVPEFKAPRVKNAQRAEVYLGVLLALLLVGIALMIGKNRIIPQANATVLSQIVSTTVGNNWAHYVIQIITVIMLCLAANTSFGGLPNLLNLLAEDDYLIHRLAARTKDGVFKNGILFLTVAAGILLIVFQAKVSALVPLYSVGVFIGFTIAQAGLVCYWWKERPFAWQFKLAINFIGATATTICSLVVITMKFDEGAWLVFVVMAVMIAVMSFLAHKYDEQDEVIYDIDAITAPLPPFSKTPLIVVPVASVSMLARKALLAGLSLGKQIIAVHVLAPEENSDQFEVAWNSIFPTVDIVVLPADEDQSKIDVLTEYVQDMSQTFQIIVVIADATPAGRWRFVLPSPYTEQLIENLGEKTTSIVAKVRVAAENKLHGNGLQAPK